MSMGKKAQQTHGHNINAQGLEGGQFHLKASLPTLLYGEQPIYIAAKVNFSTWKR